jgi:hypothetical protein
MRLKKDYDVRYLEVAGTRELNFGSDKLGTRKPHFALGRCWWPARHEIGVPREIKHRSDPH